MSHFNIFHIKREEMTLSLIGLSWVVLLNALSIRAYGKAVSTMHGNCLSQLFDTINFSGLDVFALAEMTQWSPLHNVIRHPLYAYFLYPGYLVNQGCMYLFGQNCCMYIEGLILVFCSTYTLIFLYRIIHEIIGIERSAAYVLAFMNSSFAFVMLASIAPDHFIISLFLLMLTLYVAGRKLLQHRQFTIWQTIVIFCLTAGMSLNNGVKVFIATLFTNGKHFFNWRYLSFAVIAPSLLIWGIAKLEYNHYELPRQEAAKILQAQKDREWRDSIYKACWHLAPVKDSAIVKDEANRIINLAAYNKYVRDHQKAANLHKGKPYSKKGYLKWSDATTDRWRTAVDNLFGESIQLHHDYLLEDTQVSRPLFVSYRWWFNYLVEALLVLLFIVGIWEARRSRFFWLCFSFFGFDMLLHFILGFGINEIYIMSPHFLFIIPISIAFIFKQLTSPKAKASLWAACLLLTCWLMAWNGILIISYLL
ncbi:MAG: DUF6080 domain-containing protein [Prevotella sp.]|jgi:hypothetical protein